jgi:hypothetical protein
MSPRTESGVCLAGALVFVVSLAACGNPDQASQDASPLNAIFGTPLSPAEERAKQLQQEELVATCMKAEGWEYTPVDYAAQFNNQPEFEDPTDPGYGEKYGYGIVHNYEIYELPYLDDEGNQTGDGPFGEFHDPNQDYLNSLSPDEMQQYYAALQGDPSIWEQPATETDAGGTEMFVSPPLDQQGCSGKARLEVYGEQPWDNADFSNRMNELQQELENDVDIYNAEIDWSDCVYDANPDFDFGGPDDVYMYMDERLQNAKGLERVDVDPLTGEVIGQPGVYPENGYASNEDNSEAWGYVGSGHKLSAAEIADLQQVEIDLWKADQACQKSTGLRDLRRQREEQMVDALREEYPQFVENQA